MAKKFRYWFPLAMFAAVFIGVPFIAQVIKMRDDRPAYATRYVWETSPKDLDAIVVGSSFTKAWFERNAGTEVFGGTVSALPGFRQA